VGEEVRAFKMTLPRLAYGILSVLCLVKVEATTSVCRNVFSTPCERYSKTAFTFIGVVDTHGRETPSYSSNFRTKLTVTKVYKGKMSRSVTIVSGFPFRIGGTYLVYADTAEVGYMYTSACFGTQKYDEHSMDIQFLHRLPESLHQKSIWGLITEPVEYFSMRSPVKSVSDIKVTIEGNGQHFESKTDSTGNYSFIDIPPAIYQIIIEPPKNYIDSWFWCKKSIDLLQENCGVADFTIIPDGWISGKVVDASGNPTQGLEVEIIPIDSSKDRIYLEYDLTSRTTSAGNYCIRGIPPGKYYLGSNLTDKPSGRQPYNPTYSPGTEDKNQATVIDIKLGERITNVDFLILKKFPTLEINGTVQYSDGQPVRRGSVAFDDSTKNGYVVQRFGWTDLDSLGRFSLPVLTDQSGFIMIYVYNDSTMNNKKIKKFEPWFIKPNETKFPISLIIDVEDK
jgi:hypothetical protein